MPAQAPPPVLDYTHLDAPNPRRNFILLYLGQFLPAFILLSFIVGLLVFLVPKFREIFSDFRTSLPTLTCLLILVGDYCQRFYLWLLVLPIALAVPLPLTIYYYRTENTRGVVKILLITTTLIFALFTLLAILTFVALFLPLITLISSLSGGASTAPGP